MNEACQPAGETPAIPYEDLTQSAPFQKFDGGIKLRGSLCEDCDSRMIGQRYVCSACMSRHIRPHWFGPTGRVYSSSQVHVSRTEKVPFVLAYVDLDGGARALAKLSPKCAEVEDGTLVELVETTDDWFVSPASDNKQGK